MRVFPQRSALLAILLYAFAANSASPGAMPVLKSADLVADMTIMRSAYEQLHPGLYRYNSHADMDADFAALKLQLNHDQTQQQAFLAFSEFAAKIRCGHTQANPFNQQKSLVDALFKSPTRLPYYFRWLGRHMIVTRDFTPEHVLPAGTEVTSIDGVTAAVILDKLLTIARADGANDSKRIAQLQVDGDSEYEAFDIYYAMYFPQKTASRALRVLRAGARTRESVTVTTLSFEQRIEPIKARESERKGGDAPLFEWRLLEDGSAYLRMPTWALYDSKWDWKGWLNDHLTEAVARDVPALILDLRGNEGGDDVGNEIIPHLIDAPVHASSMRRLVRYRKVPDELTPYLDTWDNSFRDWGASATALPSPWPTAPTGVRYLKLSRYDDDANGDVLMPKSPRYRGKVMVLIDATNSSATFQFAQLIQAQHLGILVGEPSGGSQRGINGGAFFFLRLPHSGIEMDLPLIGMFPGSPMPDAGITPDIVARASPASIAAGQDAALAAAQRGAQP